MQQIRISIFDLDQIWCLRASRLQVAGRDRAAGHASVAGSGASGKSYQHQSPDTRDEPSGAIMGQNGGIG